MIDNLLSCGGRRGKSTKKGKHSTINSRPLDNKPSQPIANLSDASEREVVEISERCAFILKDIVDAGCEVDKVDRKKLKFVSVVN